ILSARTSFIGLIFQLVLLSSYAFFVVFKYKKSKKFLLIIAFIVSSAMLGFINGDYFIKYNFKHYCKVSGLADKDDFTESTYSVLNRFKSIEEGNSKGRLKIWKNTITIIKDNPWLGYGIGNHKLAIMRVETKQKSNFVVSDH